jgi:hypothetical protein
VECHAKSLTPEHLPSLLGGSWVASPNI